MNLYKTRNKVGFRQIGYNVKKPKYKVMKLHFALSQKQFTRKQMID